jgi:hypothetical protein
LETSREPCSATELSPTAPRPDRGPRAGSSLTGGRGRRA